MKFETAIASTYPKRFNLSGFLCLFMLLYMQQAMAADPYRMIVHLDGVWKFSVGDNPTWASPAFNDSDWDRLYVPKNWEQQGYDEYNGYAWYRKTFTISQTDYADWLLLDLGHIDDVGEVFINGQRVGQFGQFPPVFKTAYNVRFKVSIPSSLLKPGGENLIAVRVYDSFHSGGILSGKPGIYQSIYDNLLEINLAGTWDFAITASKTDKKVELASLNWKPIQVPANWESQGYTGYDGFAYYRTNFYFSSVSYNRKLYLVLGRIDDMDFVYLNGVKIGDYSDLKGTEGYRRSGQEYRALRIYPIPVELLKINKTNELVVKVFDDMLDGGIYEGPIGIVSGDNMDKLTKLIHQSAPKERIIWDWMWDE